MPPTPLGRLPHPATPDGGEDRRAALGRQARRVEGRLARLHRDGNRLSWLRVVLFAAGLLLLAGGLIVASRGVTLAGAAALAAFAVVVRYHRRLDDAAARHAVWLRLLREQQARGARDWPAIPEPPALALLDPHPFARDLEIFGRRSLHRLCDTSATQEASERLLQWLTATEPDAAGARERQQLVRELAVRPLFRRHLACAAWLEAEAGGRWRATALLDWLAGHGAKRDLRPWLWPVTLLAAGNAVLFALHWAGAVPPIWRATFLVYVAAYWAAMRGAAEAFGEALEVRDALRPLAAVLGRFESFGYAGAPHLAERCRPLLDPERRPSAEVARVGRLLAAAGVRGNPFVWLLVNAVVPWDLHVAVRLERLKSDLTDRVPAWLDAWFEIEAAGSLADLAYLNPSYAFPTIEALDSDASAPPLRAAALSHPLLDPTAKVRNDFAFERLGEVVIVTGSNMAGKSTFVKAVGMNVALALAGGPVDAAALRLQPVRLFASIQIADSVTDGISYFYAEVKRLRWLLECLRAPDETPLLYLIDEVFRGTNNRERLIGSRELIRSMARERGVGLIATHDLELVTLADEIATVRNGHFRDDVTDGRMTFDYTLRDGPCPTTNALQIMRLEGLPAPGE